MEVVLYHPIADRVLYLPAPDPMMPNESGPVMRGDECCCDDIPPPGTCCAGCLSLYVGPVGDPSNLVDGPRILDGPVGGLTGCYVPDPPDFCEPPGGCTVPGPGPEAMELHVCASAECFPLVGDVGEVWSIVASLSCCALEMDEFGNIPCISVGLPNPLFQTLIVIPCGAPFDETFTFELLTMVLGGGETICLVDVRIVRHSGSTIPPCP